MLTRTLKRSLLDIHVLPTQLPPTFLLPLRARLFNTSSPIIDDTIPTKQPPLLINGHLTSAIDHSTPLAPQFARDDSPHPLIPQSQETIDQSSNPSSRSLYQPIQSAGLRPSLPTTVTTPKSSASLSETVKELLPQLRAQTPHYITIHIHGRPYLVTAGDIVRLPFLMHSVLPGDILRLDRATHLGSRDYTLKGSPYVDESLFVCRARVMGVEAEPMRIKKKTKRRQRHIKTVRSKHKFTILRVTELTIQEAVVHEGGSVGELINQEEGGNSKLDVEI